MFDVDVDVGYVNRDALFWCERPRLWPTKPSILNKQAENHTIMSLQ